VLTRSGLFRLPVLFCFYLYYTVNRQQPGEMRYVSFLIMISLYKQFFIIIL
jgi:hypothetical protein